MKRFGLVVGSVLALVFAAGTAPHMVRASGLYTIATGGGFSPCHGQFGGMEETQPNLCPSGSPGQPNDSTGQHFAFSAREDMTLTASGHAVFWFVNGNTQPEKKLLQVSGQVTCVAVVGNIAMITFQVSQESGSEQPTPPLVGSYVTFGAQDNGPPSQNNPYFDKISTLHPAAGGRDDCTGYPPDQDVTRGNVTVQTDTGLLAVPMTDGSTYNITDAGDVLYNAGDGWQQAP